jgi:hypothetical protein
VSRVQPVKDGALLTFEIRSWPDDATKERLDRGHKGPCAVYLKKVDDASTDKAVGDGWFKIFDHGYDSATDRWCTDEIIDNNGLLSVHLPKGMEGGDYLARPEIIALHVANKDDPQTYTGCAQIFLESSGNLVPESTVSIPGYMKYGTPSTHFDIYNTDNSEYVIPGPKVAKLTLKGVQTASTTQTEGLKPEGCIMENANWCGKEVPSYSDEEGCWASQENCWDQGKVCFSSSPPTGNAGCDLWQKKCQALQDACTAKKFNGPPNKGKVLTPVKKAVDVGMIMATIGGGIVDAPSSTKKAESKTATQAEATAEAPVESVKPTTTAAAKTSESLSLPPLLPLLRSLRLPTRPLFPSLPLLPRPPTRPHLLRSRALRGGSALPGRNLRLSLRQCILLLLLGLTAGTRRGLQSTRGVCTVRRRVKRGKIEGMGRYYVLRRGRESDDSVWVRLRYL